MKIGQRNEVHKMPGHAEFVVQCADLDANQAFFTEQLGMRVERVFPADDPEEVSVAGYGARLLLRRSDTNGTALTFRIPFDGQVHSAEKLTAPSGVRIEYVRDAGPVDVPRVTPAYIVTRAPADAAYDTTIDAPIDATDERVWIAGRAGMQYRDLIPGRLGGAFVASHIRIPQGGPVPDYVHYHRVAFQLIYCVRGWVRVVYEDQGPPFVLHPGDAVLQPPGIRHRVLECSDELEVVEISSPARHETFADHDLELPTPVRVSDREFEGQRFVHHVAAGATWLPTDAVGCSVRSFGLLEATGGRAAAQATLLGPSAETAAESHDDDLLFRFVLDGAVTVAVTGEDREMLHPGDSVVVPGGVSHTLSAGLDGALLLEVRVPRAVA